VKNIILTWAKVITITQVSLKVSHIGVSTKEMSENRRIFSPKTVQGRACIKTTFRSTLPGLKMENLWFDFQYAPVRSNQVTHSSWLPKTEQKTKPIARVCEIHGQKHHSLTHNLHIY
jgi:hypothetical protein